MIETVKVKINNQEYTYSKGMTLEEIAAEHQKDKKFPILLARVNNRVKELSSKLKEDCEIEFLDLTSREGGRAHTNGLVYIMVYAVKKLFGNDNNIIVQHSLDKGIYIETTFKITENRLKTLKDTMKAIISADMPISKVTIDRLEAIKYFNGIKDYAKAGVMKYNTNSYITLYRLGNSYNYFYGPMANSTSRLKDFDFTLVNDYGFVLRFPTTYSNGKIKEYKHQPNMFAVFKEQRDWAKIMKIENAVDLNKIVSTGKVNDLIKIDETLKSNRMLQVAQEINARKKDVKIVLVAGPSSSGKTTSSRKLCMYLQSFGLTPKVISMDDYFVERDQTPLDEDGKPDYECLEAMDVKLFDKQMAALLRGEKVTVPTFNFAAGIKEFKNEMQFADDDIMIIEGIHALDDKILTNIDRKKKYKIYISALTEINMDDHNRICTSDNRLLRRIIRDNRTRGYGVDHTLKLWPSVRRGEEKYIFPFQDDADATINSALIYEIGVLKTYVEPLLYSVDSDSPYYEEAKRLINFLRLFLPIPADAIPADSILREFIGGSYFHE